MAKDLNRSIKIYIDNSDAMANAQKLENKISSLRAELQKLSAEGKKDTREYTSQEKALNKLERSYGNYKNKIQETERVLNNLSGSTYKELTAAKKTLRNELQKTERGTEAYTQKLKAYKSVQNETNIAQKEMNGTLGSQGNLFSRAANGFNKYFAMVTAGLAAVTGISFTLRKLSQDAAEFQDTYADVRKTTGMTAEEVADLNEEFKKIDTRTSRDQLNMLARDAGKLGIESKEQVLGFVDAANQIQVALGEDLGEGAIRDIGKIADVYTRSTKEMEQMDLKGKMLAVGSAINEIGASSSANEDYLVQFAGRLGGVATQAGIGVDKIIGFASALDQDMQQVEMSATALQQFIMKIMGDPAKFAQIAGMEVSAFSKLLKTDANDAIKLVLRSLNEKGGFQDLIPYFDEMGLSGARAVGVLSSLAGSIDKVDEAQRLANKSMVEGVSLTNEYNIKNNNAAAEIEKRQKLFIDASEELGNRLNPALLKSTNIVTYIVKLLPRLLDFLGTYGKYILYLATVYAVYTVGVKLNVLWNTKLKTALTLSNIQLRIQNVLMLAGKVATLTYNVVVGLLTGNLIKARAAFKLLNITMASNPLGLILAGVAALAGGIFLLHKRLTRVTSETDAFNKINKEASKSIAEEKTNVDLLLQTAQDEMLSREQRVEAIKKLNEISPEYLGNLTLENINTQAATTAIDNYTDALMRNARQKAIGDKMSELQAKRLDQEAKLAEHQQILDDRRAAGIGQTDIDRSHQNAIKNINNKISAIDKESEAYKKLNQTVDRSVVNLSQPGKDRGIVTDSNNPKTNNNDTKVPGTPDKKAYEKALENLEKYIAHEKSLIQQKYMSGKTSQQEYNRELEYLELERLRKNLEISSLTAEQRQDIEFKIFETKLKMLKNIEDEEKKHQDQITEIQRQADEARAQQNWNNLKNIAKQNEENGNEQIKKMLQQKADLAALGFDFANEIGTMVGSAISGNENMVASSLQSIVNMALDALKIQVQMAIAGATVTSLAQPDSVATLGATGFARAALMVGLIEAAFAAVKGVVNSAIGKIGNNDTRATTDSNTGSYVIQRAAGKYDVLGASDGKAYNGIPYLGPASTGVVPHPVLVGEYGPELIVSAPDFKRLQHHVNYPVVLDAIQQSRVSQRAAGNYESLPPTPIGSNDNSEIMRDIRNLLADLKSNGVKAPIVLSELQRKQEILNKSQRIGSK